jgi:phosphoglycolate phosphatase
MNIDKHPNRTTPFQYPAGVIFDLDGTLADTLQDITAGVNHALATENLPPARAEQIQAWVGEGYLVLMKRAAPRASETQLKRLVHAGAAYYMEHALDRTHLYTGILDVVKTLIAKGLRVAVLSNKPEPVTIDIVRKLCPIAFDAIVGYRDEASKKPNPALALEIASRMGLPPERIAFVGDSATDIATARNAGMPAISVTWGFRSREQLQPVGPDALVDRPAEILDLLCPDN